MKPEMETIGMFIQAFKSYFSRLEWESINKAGSPDETLAVFYRYWSLKEAYVKATGSGLADELDKVEFRHDNWTNITISIDGKLDEEWRFSLHELPKRHWLSIARGHPKAAVESYKSTMRRTEFSEEEFQESVRLPNVGIVARTVDQLITRLRGVDSKHTIRSICGP
ncbi:L-aminoadipate-semialdehyde dehydrogenase-phosphopantetheinyl transferase [Linum grandiflorum]